MGAIRDAIATAVKRFLPDQEETTRSEREQERTEQHSWADLGSAWAEFEKRTKIERTRQARYNDFETMDAEDALCNAFLDVYADNSLHSREGEELLITVETEQATTRTQIQDLFDRLKLTELLWPLTRDLCKFGDVFEEHVMNRDKEILSLSPLDRATMFRQDPPKKPFAQKNAAGQVATEFEDHEVTHFALHATRNQVYGTSVLAPIRKLYKQLAMMEDGMVIRRITRATQRYGFIIPTGKLVGNDAREYVRKVREDLRKRRLLTSEGKLSLRDAPMFQDEDFFIGQPEGEHGDIKVLQGDGNLGNIGDVQYFLNKMFAAMKIPKGWMGFEQDTAARAVLTEQAVSFARTARRVQVAVRNGLHHLADVQYMLRGVDPTSVKYRILLPAMSSVDELRMWELAKLKAEVAKVYAVDMKLLTDEYILVHFVGLSKEEAQELLRQKAEQAALEAEMQAQMTALQQPQPPAMPPAQEQLWQHFQLMGLIESVRDLSRWSLEHRRWEQARDPAPEKTIVYLPESRG